MIKIIFTFFLFETPSLMAITVDSSVQSSQNSSDSGNGSLSSSPWVRGGETESITSPSLVLNSGEQSTFSDCSNSLDMYSLENNDNIAADVADVAWKKPWNGQDVSPVMGAVSWPALSESTKPFSKLATTTTDLCPANIVVSSDRSMPTNQGDITTQTSHKATRQRSMKRGGSNNYVGGHSQNTFTQPPLPPPPPPFPIFAIPPNGYVNWVPPIPDQTPTPRAPLHRGNSNWEPRAVRVGRFVPQPHTSSMRSNSGPRGESSYCNNFRGRRDQDRGHHGNAKDAPVQPQRSPRGFFRPPNTAPFVPPQPVRPFANPMGFPDLVYMPTLAMEPFRGVPLMAHAAAPAMIMPVPESSVPAMLIHQIEYYFSDANLIRDGFLKSNMDNQGWVSITLIAGFNRVKSMTKDIQLIVDSLRTSTVLEVQDNKVRRRNDWMKWTTSPSRLSSSSAVKSTGHSSSHDMLTSSFENMTMEEVTSNQNSTDLNSQKLMTQSRIGIQEDIEDSSSSSS